MNPVASLVRLAALCLLLPAGMAHAFTRSAGDDGYFDYFFSGARSLGINSAGDIDLSGLSFLQLSDGGVNIRASFELLPGLTDFEASSAGGVSWSAAAAPESVLEMAAGGSITLAGSITGFETINISAAGPLIVEGSITSQNLDTSSATLIVGESVVAGQEPGIATGIQAGSSLTLTAGGIDIQLAPGSSLHFPVGATLVGGDLAYWTPTDPSGASITLDGSAIGEFYGTLDVDGTLVLISEVPEPGMPLLLATGLLALTGLRRNGNQRHGDVDSKTESAAFAMASWAILFGTPDGGGNYSLNSATFQVDGTPQGAALATTYLGELHSFSGALGNYQVSYLYDGDPATQDMVVFAVPEPESYALLLGGLGLIGLLARRRKQV